MTPDQLASLITYKANIDSRIGDLQAQSDVLTVAIQLGQGIFNQNPLPDPTVNPIG